MAIYCKRTLFCASAAFYTMAIWWQSRSCIAGYRAAAVFYTAIIVRSGLLCPLSGLQKLEVEFFGSLLYGIPFLTNFKCIWRPCLQKSAKRNRNKFLKIYSIWGAESEWLGFMLTSNPWKKFQKQFPKEKELQKAWSGNFLEYQIFGC